MTPSSLLGKKVHLDDIFFQHTLFRLTVDWKKGLESNKFIGVSDILTGVSEGFDCLPKNHLLAKLSGYREVRSSSLLKKDYLTGIRKVKVKGEYIILGRIGHGVLQVSMLGPMLFKGPLQPNFSGRCKFKAL